jgi:hypothetical protein
VTTSTRETWWWHETGARLAGLQRRFRVMLDERRAAFEARDAGGALVARLVPPIALPIPADARDADDYLDALPATLGCQLLVLLQAGAAAFGVWRDDELLAHKSLKKYVVRGHGRAQTTHLRTRGRSRYGSRLRLQNARALLVEVNEKLAAWQDAFGPFDRIWHACGVRQWGDLFAAETPPPFPRGASLRVPLHVHVPDFAELQAVRVKVVRGRLEWILGQPLPPAALRS